jgi:hypothetical protein
MRASSIDHWVGHEAVEASAALKPIWQRLLDRAIDFFLVVWMFLTTERSHLCCFPDIPLRI